MARFTKITSVRELKNIFIETLLNKTPKVTKVSDDSVISGIGFGVAKVAQKALLEVARVESLLFPDAANGDQLDAIASNFGVADRFGASGASTYVRIEAVPGTFYSSSTTVTGSEGITFSFENDVTIDESGYAYTKVSTITKGETSNVPPLSLITVNPIPVGHELIVNEYRATGGRDNESDEDFRRRIKSAINSLSKGTIASLEQAMYSVNENILRAFYQGRSSSGNLQIAVETQDGRNLTPDELNTLLQGISPYLSISDQRPNGFGRYGISLTNVTYQPIDVNFRVELEDEVTPSAYRKAVQIKFQKYIDSRKFDPVVEKIEWDDLLQIAKETKGARYIPDRFFFIGGSRNDIIINRGKSPRFRSFILFDSLGSVIDDTSGILNSQFFPNQIDFNFQQTINKQDA